MFIMRGLALLLMIAPAVASADGEVTVRHAYYKERSTRVQQPMIDAAFDTGNAGRVDAHFLVDSITSASAATGSSSPFTELRYEGGLGYTAQLPGHVKLGAAGRYSTESDYTSLFFAGHGEVALFDQNTTLRLLAGISSDDISNQIEVDNGSLGTPRRQESLSTQMVSAGVSQVLAPWVVASLNYDFVRLSGFQANMYRVVRGGSAPALERVPELRLRHAVAVSARAYLPSRTTVIVGYRLYLDDWGVAAHTPEARVVQQIIDGLDVRARYRFYTQSKADFYKDVYTMAELDDPAVYVTNDDKLSAFTTHTFGGQVTAALSLLGVRGGAGGIRGDLVVERILQSTSFGNAWTAQAGLTFPFSY